MDPVDFIAAHPWQFFGGIAALIGAATWAVNLIIPSNASQEEKEAIARRRSLTAGGMKVAAMFAVGVAFCVVISRVAPIHVYHHYDAMPQSLDVRVKTSDQKAGASEVNPWQAGR